MIDTYDPNALSIAVSDKALAHFKRYVQKEGGIGVRLGVEKTGCSGLSYVNEVVSEMPANHQQLEKNGLTLFVDNQALPYLNGMEVDFQKGQLGQSHVVYTNPNEAARCGCGESFTVKE